MSDGDVANLEQHLRWCSQTTFEEFPLIVDVDDGDTAEMDVQSMATGDAVSMPQIPECS